MKESDFNGFSGYHFNILTRIFPFHKTSFLSGLMDLKLNELDKYGVSLSYEGLYKTVSLIEQELYLIKPSIINREKETLNEIKHSYLFLTVWHNIHKTTSQYIATSCLNEYYLRIFALSNGPVGLSILQYDETIIKNLTKRRIEMGLNNETDMLKHVYENAFIMPLEKLWIVESKYPDFKFDDFKDVSTSMLKELS
jgi:hypothetical protein